MKKFSAQHILLFGENSFSRKTLGTIYNMGRAPCMVTILLQSTYGVRPLADMKSAICYQRQVLVSIW